MEARVGTIGVGYVRARRLRHVDSSLVTSTWIGDETPKPSAQSAELACTIPGTTPAWAIGIPVHAVKAGRACHALDGRVVACLSIAGNAVVEGYNKSGYCILGCTGLGSSPAKKVLKVYSAFRI